MPAFELALSQGADALELDVRLSRDGVPVVIHDAKVDRTTDRRSFVSAFDAAELARMDAGYEFRPRLGSDGPVSFPWRGQGVIIPTLAEVLGAFPQTELLIEIKEVGAQAAVLAEIRRARAEDRCAVGADQRAALEVFRGSRVAVCASRPEVATLWARATLGLAPVPVTCELLSVPLTWHGLPIATERLFRTARAAGLPVHVWTVDDPVVARRRWAGGAGGIVTNDPLALVHARRTAEPPPGD